MNNPGLEQEWRERLQDYAQAEMTVEEWCHVNRVSIHQYYYWRRRLAAPPTRALLPKGANSPSNGVHSRPNSIHSRWQAVEILESAQPSATKGGLSVHIGGATIPVETGFDPQLLRAVVLALATPPC